MLVIALRYAGRRIRIRVKESFNESFLRLTLHSDVTSCDGLTSRFLLSDVMFSYALTSRFHQ